jgi:hypothetical protein
VKPSNNWPSKATAAGALTHYQAGQLLGLSRFLNSTISRSSAGFTTYSIADLQQDLADLEKLRAQGLIGK